MNNTSWLKKIWDFVRSPDNLTKVFAVLAAVIFLLMRLRPSNFLPQLNNAATLTVEDKLVFNVILLVLGLIATSEIFQRIGILTDIHSRLTSSETERLRIVGISEFYSSRRELPPLPEFISSAKHDLLILGLSAEGLITAHQHLIEICLRQGCNVRFLLPKSLNQRTIAHLAPARDSNRAPAHLKDSLAYLVHLAEEDGLDSTGKLQVKLYDFVPTLGLIMVDGDETYGKIRVELLPYKSQVVDRPSFELVRAQHGTDLYSLFKSQYDLLWREAEVWNRRYPKK